MRAEGNEEVIELLFPAGCLLRRMGEWDLLARLVPAIEAAVSATGQGYAEPWQATARTWARDAEVGLGGAVPGHDTPAADLEALRLAVRAWLGEVAVASR